jgi:hypothetical protein
MKIQPVDLEALKREQKPFDVQLAADVLCELISRQRGYIQNGFVLRATLTPKNPGEVKTGG